MTSRSTLVQMHILELGGGTMRDAPFGLGSAATAEADRSEVSWIH